MGNEQEIPWIRLQLQENTIYIILNVVEWHSIHLITYYSFCGWTRNRGTPAILDMQYLFIAKKY